MGQTLSLCAGSGGPPCVCVCSVCAACMLGVCVHVRACMCSGYVCAHVCVSVLDVCVCVCVCVCMCAGCAGLCVEGTENPSGNRLTSLWKCRGSITGSRGQNGLHVSWQGRAGGGDGRGRVRRLERGRVFLWKGLLVSGPHLMCRKRAGGTGVMSPSGNWRAAGGQEGPSKGLH